MSKLLVIGNGFDRSVGARTSYSHFFESSFFSVKKEKVFEWIKCCDKKTGFPQSIFNIMDFEFNCWDLLFCLESDYHLKPDTEIHWCDVEKVIYDSLINTELSSFSWEHVREIMENKSEGREYHFGDPPIIRLLNLENACRETKIVAGFLYQSNEWREGCKDKTVFYGKLLEALKQFEESFGCYIRQETSSDEYQERAKNLANDLLDNPLDPQIDSFNYSDFIFGRNKSEIRHINGDCEAPIFGINLSLEEETRYPELRHFTKTARRVHQNVENQNRHTRWGIGSVEHAVVFGHSLNRMDYDYFYYLFTMLRFHTFDMEKMGSIEFVYKDYDMNQREIKRANFADSVYRLISYYEGCVSNFNEHILMNMLMLSGKLTIRELHQK